MAKTKKVLVSRTVSPLTEENIARALVEMGRPILAKLRVGDARLEHRAQGIVHAPDALFAGAEVEVDPLLTDGMWEAVA